jgi:hypothetical protein
VSHLVSGSIVKQILRWPFLLPDGTVSNRPLPGPLAEGGGSFINVAAGPVTTVTTPDPLPAAGGSQAGNLLQKLALPRTCGLRGIGISPDSAIAACDLWTGINQSESQRYRLSPGNPYIGGLEDAESIYVSVPIGIPLIPTADQLFAPDSVTILSLGVKICSWPLRLDLLYDDAPLSMLRVDRRAPISARCRFRLAAATSGFMYVCVDGRRHVAIEVSANTATASLRVSAVSSIYANSLAIDNSDVPQPLVLPDTALPAGMTRRDFVCPGSNDLITGVVAAGNGLPAQVWEIRLTDSAGNAGTGHLLNFYAWDE